MNPFYIFCIQFFNQLYLSYLIFCSVYLKNASKFNVMNIVYLLYGFYSEIILNKYKKIQNIKYKIIKSTKSSKNEIFFNLKNL